MTNFEKATEIAVESIKRDAEFSNVDWDYVDDWNKLLDWFGQDSSDMKDDIYYTLSRSELSLSVFDDCSIEDSDGSIKTYRQLTNAIRKQLFE